MRRRSIRLAAGQILLLIAFLLVGCGPAKVSDKLSPQVRKLWERHPAPWTTETALAAAEDARSVLNEFPDDIQVELYYQDRMQLADREKLRAEYAEKVADSPDNPRVILLNALVAGGRSDVVALTQRVESLSPNDPYVLSLASYLLSLRREDPERAERYAAKAVKIAPKLPLAHFASGYAALRAGFRDEAIEEAEKALEGDPYSFDNSWLLASAYELTPRGNADVNVQAQANDALKVLEDYNQAHPGNPDAIRALTMRYRSLGELEKALELQKPLAFSDSENGWAFYDLARLYAEINQPDSCLRYLDLAVENGFYDHNLLIEEAGEKGNPFSLLLRYTKKARELQTGAEDGAVEDTIHASLNPEIAMEVARRYGAVQNEMLRMQRATREERKMKALADRLDIPAPQWSFEDDKGDTVSLSDLRGKVVVLDFWATWCRPCQMTIPRLRAFYIMKAQKTQDVRLFSINIWERVDGDARKNMVGEFMKKESMIWPVLFGDDMVGEAYEVRGIPTFIVIDPDGVIRYRISGYYPFLDETLGWMADAAGEKR